MSSLIDSIPPSLIDEERTAASSTCDWFLRTQQFCTWRSGPMPLLWICGEFGCGKTVLLSFLKERLSTGHQNGDQDQATIDNTLIVCGFFFNKLFKGYTNATALLRCLIWDLLTQCPDMFRHVLKYYESSRPWSYTQLWKCLQAIMDDRRKRRLCFIIDALDECDAKDTKKFLNDLVKYIETSSHQESFPIKFILSSRPLLSGPLDKLEKASYKVSLDQDLVLQQHRTAAIQSFALDDLLNDGVFSWNDPEREDKTEALAEDIAMRAEGCFLWAALVCERLHNESFIEIGDIKNFLTECPVDIKGIYSEALANVKSSYYDKISKSLNILLAASRPLTISEFMAALTIENKTQTLEDLQQSAKERDHITAYMEQILGPLLRIDKSTITFRHQSARDFLLNHLSVPKKSSQNFHSWKRSGECEALSFFENKAQDVLAVCSINYLSIIDFRLDIGPQNDNLEILEMAGFEVMDDFPFESQQREAGTAPPGSCPPFFEYAALNWSIHFTASGDDNYQSVDAALSLLTDSNVLTHWSRQFRRNSQRYPNMPESLDASIIVAYLGLSSILPRLRLNTDLDLDWKTALTWASRTGHLHIIDDLLKSGVPPQGEYVEGRKAFSWAVAGGYFDIVNLLLSYDVNLVNEQDTDECCPLIFAVFNHDQAMVTRLLALDNINVNLRSKQGTCAISLAIERPNPTAAELHIFLQLLNDPRVDITSRDNDGRTCLSYLAQYGATEAIKAILDRDERQEAVAQLLDDKGDNRGFSPLSYAAWWGNYSSTVRVLCETNRVGSQLESKDKLDGDNVFQKAARYGHADVIRELGKHYPSGVNCRDNTGRTPLSTAMWNENPEVLRALLECGADPNIPDNGGNVAITYGFSKIALVRLLARHGANMNFKDNDGHTPLWRAQSQNVDEITIKRLKDLGAHF